MREPEFVTLSDEQTYFADNIAALRQTQAFMKGRANANGLTGDFDKMLSVHRLGARCEAAAKLYLNPIKWHAYAEKITGLPDLGTFIDVKGINQSFHKLIIQKDDEPYFTFLLVDASEHPVYRIVGWIKGKDGKQERFMADPIGGRPAYFVPQTELLDPKELLVIVHRGPG